MEKESKRFEGWEEVDCNECEHWWTSSCDGASKGSRVGCNSFSATRSIVIPERLNALEKNLRSLECALSVVVLLVVILYGVMYYCG